MLVVRLPYRRKFLPSKSCITLSAAMLLPAVFSRPRIAGVNTFARWKGSTQQRISKNRDHSCNGVDPSFPGSRQF
jgi:hypothetical protein